VDIDLLSSELDVEMYTVRFQPWTYVFDPTV
jgi:hypothetical protein